MKKFDANRFSDTETELEWGGEAFHMIYVLHF